MLELPPDCLLQIMLFSLSMDVIEKLQFVSKHWHEAANNMVLWKDVSIRTLQNKRFQGFLKTHGKHIQKLHMTSLRLSRNATWKIVFNCTKLYQLDLTHCYSDSLIDEKFCFLISKLQTLRKILLPNESKINDTGFRYLSKMPKLSALQLRGNHHIIDFSPIKKLKQLSYLDLSSCVYVDNRLCEWIADFKLGYLNLSYCYQVNINGFESFFKYDHPELETFRFLNVNVNDTFITSVLSRKSGLTNLTLNSLSINQEIYKALSSLEKVRDLSIIGCAKIEDFRVLKLKALEHILICRTAFDTHGKKGLINFVDKQKQVKVHLYDAYHLQHKDSMELIKHDNIFIEYS